MRMLMRLQKTQVLSIQKNHIGGSSGVFKKHIFELAGFTQVQITLVGGAGGRSGNAYGTNPANNVAYGGGGGAGGSLRLTLPLSALAPEVAWSVGKAGGTGKDGSNGVRAGQGGNATDSVFGTYKAFGGNGALGGLVKIETNGDWFYDRTLGGYGGGNSANLGDGGLGGGRGTSTPAAAPTDGTIVSSGGVVGGKGGAGGIGKVLTAGTTRAAAQPGSDGHVGLGNVYRALGGGTSSGRGGFGGGFNLGPVLGGPAEYYGSGVSGHSPDGVVLLQLS